MVRWGQSILDIIVVCDSLNNPEYVNIYTMYVWHGIFMGTRKIRKTCLKKVLKWNNNESKVENTDPWDLGCLTYSITFQVHFAVCILMMISIISFLYFLQIDN